MHWFWRAAIAILLGCVFAGLIIESHLFDGGWPSFPYTPWLRLPLFVSVVVLPPVVLAVLLYGLLSRFAGQAGSDSETRCRKCQYILRGITEPRCPECGERI